MNELLELINSVKTAAECNEVELWGDKKSFDELIASRFPLEDFKYTEIEFNKPRIMIIPCESKPLNLYFDEGKEL